MMRAHKREMTVYVIEKASSPDVQLEEEDMMRTEKMNSEMRESDSVTKKLNQCLCIFSTDNAMPR